jgi:hypothetical protein
MLLKKLCGPFRAKVESGGPARTSSYAGAVPRRNSAASVAGWRKTEFQREWPSQTQQSLQCAQRSQMWLSQASRVQWGQISVDASPQM